MGRLRTTLLSIATAIGAYGTASAIPWAIIVPIAGALGIVYRNFVPTNTALAFNFFSSCWTCRIFSGVTNALSNAAATVYSNLGEFVAILAVVLTPIWFAFVLLGKFVSSNPETNAIDGWKIGTGFGLHILKLVFISALLLMPLPQLVTRTAIEPAMNIALSFQRVLSEADTENSVKFDACLIASVALENPQHNQGLFSMGFKNKMRCSIASLHSLTATGITAGWLLFNSAFDVNHMYKFKDTVPFFPNIGMILMGFILIIVYLWIILPIALVFLEFVMKLAIDMIFLPMTLLGWLFKGNKIWEVKDTDVQEIITGVIKMAVSLGLVMIFMGFALMLTGYALGGEGSMAALGQAFMNNDARAIIGQDSFINSATMNLVMIGLFLAIFITTMTKLIQNLVNGAHWPDKMLADAKKYGDHIWGYAKKIGKTKEAAE
ncbi:MAG: hypothetical protein FWD33_04330 [Alphaproteobacteria bacterium]|nr:hypothetical protein [Alphaproteobacteria bacterium]